jgi:hypothetical protein
VMHMSFSIRDNRLKQRPKNSPNPSTGNRNLL